MRTAILLCAFVVGSGPQHFYVGGYAYPNAVAPKGTSLGQVRCMVALNDYDKAALKKYADTHKEAGTQFGSNALPKLSVDLLHNALSCEVTY